MRSLRLVAIASLVFLACSDSTGLGLEGPSFLRAWIDGRLVALGEDDSYLLASNATMIQVQALTGTLMPAGSPYIVIQISNYQGPGTYQLGDYSTVGGWAQYGIVSGTPPAVVQSFGTTAQYTGSVHIIAADTVAGLIAGTFEFSALATSGTGTVHITQGSFRIHPALHRPNTQSGLTADTDATAAPATPLGQSPQGSPVHR